MTDHPNTEATPSEIELHELRTDLPNWDTKQRCTCGYESPSKAEQWKHQADSLRAVAIRLPPLYAVVEAAQAMVDNHRERRHWTARSVVELDHIARAQAALALSTAGDDDE